MRKRLRVVRHEVIQPLDQPFRYIPLTQGQNAIVDTEDFEWLSQWNWSVNWKTTAKKYCARRQTWTNGIRGSVYMHNVIMQCNKGQEVDHKNHDTLDNRKENLRKSTRIQNMSNRLLYVSNKTGYKGVFWRKDYRKWVVSISHRRKRIHLGYFTSIKDAARAYDSAAKIYHGEFAVLNLPD